MAGPDHGNGELSTDSDTTEAAVQARVPRKSAPIRQLRRKKAQPQPATAAAAEQSADIEEPQSDSAPATAVSVDADTKQADAPASDDTASGESSPQRAGAALSYRERRRAGAGTGATPARVVRKKADRSKLGLALAGVVAAVVVIALAVVSVLFANGTDRIDNRASDRAAYSAFARQMIVNLTSLSPTTIDQVTSTFESKTSGKALEQLQTSLQQTTDLIKSQGVTTKGTILSDAVVSSDTDSATVMLVSGWTMDTPATPTSTPAPAGTAAGGDTVVQTFRWKVTITKINGEMKMTDVEWVT